MSRKRRKSSNAATNSTPPVRQLPPKSPSTNGQKPQIITPPTNSALAVSTPTKLFSNVTTTSKFVSSKPVVYPHKPRLTFSPYAWAKLLFMRDQSNNEVGAFAIASNDELLHITDLVIVKQVVSGASVSFDDEGVADFFDAQVLLERKPVEFASIWVHTHPGNCAKPSLTDYETFDRVFGVTNWAVMFILAQGGDTSCELRFNTGPKASLELPITINYSKPFPAADFSAWEKEYKANVSVHTYTYSYSKPISDYTPKSAQFPAWEERAEALDYDLQYDVDDSFTVPVKYERCDMCVLNEDVDFITVCPNCKRKYCLTCLGELDQREDAYICAECGDEFTDSVGTHASTI